MIRNLTRCFAAYVTVLGLLGLASPTASATPEAQANLVRRVTTSSNPKAVFDKLTPSQQQVVISELSGATFKASTTLAPNTGAMAAPYSFFSGCWSRGISGTFYGGITRSAMFTVYQTTRVCVRGGSVYSVSVIGPGAYSNGYIGLYIKDVSSATSNVGWEGRGVAVGTAALGAGGWDVATKTLCVQMRLNANGYNYLGLQQCTV